jgi:hypothetical protein
MADYDLTEFTRLPWVRGDQWFRVGIVCALIGLGLSAVSTFVDPHAALTNPNARQVALVGMGLGAVGMYTSAADIYYAAIHL